MDELIDYSLYDVNGDAYIIKVKKHEAAKYDIDHIMSYRMLNKLKRNNVPPTRRDNGETSVDFQPLHNSTMELMTRACPSPILGPDDLRSPQSKRGRQDQDCADARLNESFGNVQLDEDEVEELATPLPEKSNNPVTYEWPKNAVHLLINELGKRIHKFKITKKKTIIPKEIYEEISVIMRGLGWPYPAQSLHDKKRGLDSSFCRYKKAGNAAWPFMTGMSHLHSGKWPAGFKSGNNQDEIARQEDLVGQEEEGDGQDQEGLQQVQEGLQPEQEVVGQEQEGFEPEVMEQEREVVHPERNADRNGAGGPAQDKFKWCIESDDALIHEFYQAREHFSGKKLVRNKDKFAYVADQLIEMGLAVDADMCKARFEILKSKFNDEYDRTAQTGESASTWIHFGTFLSYEEGSLACKPQVSVSLGAVSKVKKADEIVHKVRAGNKGRPAAAARVERLAGLNTTKQSSSSRGTAAIGYQNRLLDIQERRLQLEENYLAEFKAYSQEFRERGQTLREGVRHLREMKNDFSRRSSSE